MKRKAKLLNEDVQEISKEELSELPDGMHLDTELEQKKLLGEIEDLVNTIKDDEIFQEICQNNTDETIKKIKEEKPEEFNIYVGKLVLLHNKIKNLDSKTQELIEKASEFIEELENAKSEQEQIEEKEMEESKHIDDSKVIDKIADEINDFGI